MIKMKKGGLVYLFVRWDNIYIHDTKNPGHVLASDHLSMVTTVKNNASKYTKREVKDAEKARDLMRKIGDPSPESMCERLRLGKIKSTEVTPSDVWRSIAIWGKSIETIKGKTTSHQAPVVKVERLPVDEVQKNQELQVDMMYVDKVAFLLGVLVPMKYIFLAPVMSRAQKEIWPALKKFITLPRSRGITVDVVRTDLEGAVMASEADIASLGCSLNPGGAKEAVPVVERTIRTIKERCRGIINSLPYTLPYFLIAALCIFVVQRLNMFPSSTTVNAYSPRELMWNRIVDAKTDLALGFGDYVQAHRNLEDNSMEPRTDGALALYPVGNLEGTWAFYNLNTNRVIKRNHWTEVPLDQSVIDHMNSASNKQKRKLPVDVKFSRGETEIEDLDEDPDAQDNDRFLPPEENLPEMIKRAEDVTNDIPIEYDDSFMDNFLDTISIHSPPSTCYAEDMIVVEDEHAAAYQSENLSVEENIEGLTEEILVAPEESTSIPEVTVAPIESSVPTPRYNLRPSRAEPGRWVSKPGTQNLSTRREFGLHMSTRAAIKIHGNKALDAMTKEMAQILEKGTIRGICVKSLTPLERSKIIRSHMFFKEKYLPTGEFEKLKARFVAGGDMQDRSLYTESQLSSKTVSTSSVFLVATVAAKEKRAVATVDFPGAYLNSDLPKDGQKVFMRLDPHMTGVLVKLDQKYKSYVNQDGTVIVQVIRGLYGLIEAAKLWYDKLTSLLTKLNFEANPYDPCVFNRKDPQGNQITLAIHVDDMFISGPSEDSIEQLLKEIEAEYPGLSINRGRKLNYLGMIFNFEVEGICEITMDGFIEDLLSTCEDIKGIASTPAGSGLFELNEKSPTLERRRAKEFHSQVAKLLYLAKRSRPDLLTAVAFLTTRVQNPTEEDWSKLERAIRYIRGTKALGIRLKADKSMVIIVYVDASFAVHPNMRSHTGVLITLFRGPIYAKSSKQKLMTKSSTEAELVAISDALGQVMWTRNFMEAQGYKLPPVKLFEDNMSTIALVKNGKSNSNRTRHIAIRYFFVSDKVETKEIEIDYMPTESMLADVLTKPLQGALFRRLRDELLNVSM
jgi:hypothetical protein